jgi:hypothetical protein
LSGLTVATWLNGKCVKIASVVANTSITFTDPTSHGASGSQADTGSVVTSYIKYSKTTANVALTQDTGAASQQATGSYSALKIAVTETALAAGTTNKLIECLAGASAATAEFSVDNKGTVTSAGGRIVSRAAKSTNYTSTATDFVLVFTASATLTLDSGAAVSGTTYRIKLGTAAAGGSSLIISPNNSKTIDGNASQTLSTLGQSIDVVYDGSTNWEIF